ncbi:chaperone modulator CbpM [Psychrobacter sp. I-STPA6b]|uniref:chaperone modulator CbpM n=1 Tax=Psychrobacter sp. I-STPA6b TaxID=2585718 RepID=UPI001D0C6925|nr:chaperone modulator CbpM [Psychrobacter sp. I-STPA6b]
MQHSAELNDIIMSLDELVTACGQERSWVLALIDENIITPDVDIDKVQELETSKASTPTSAQNEVYYQHFSGYQLATVRRASRLSRDFDASVPAIGLILELLAEVEQLRQFKRQFEPQSTQVIEVKWD